MSQKAAKVWFAAAGATNWTESTICKAKDLFYAQVSINASKKTTAWLLKSMPVSTTVPPVCVRNL
jgi:hypothetical protein